MIYTLLHKSHSKLLTFSYLDFLKESHLLMHSYQKSQVNRQMCQKSFRLPKKEKRLCERRKETIYDIRKVPKSSKITKEVLWLNKRGHYQVVIRFPRVELQKYTFSGPPSFILSFLMRGIMLWCGAKVLFPDLLHCNSSIFHALSYLD